MKQVLYLFIHSVIIKQFLCPRHGVSAINKRHKFLIFNRIKTPQSKPHIWPGQISIYSAWSYSQWKANTSCSVLIRVWNSCYHWNVWCRALERKKLCRRKHEGPSRILAWGLCFIYTWLDFQKTVASVLRVKLSLWR